MTLVESMLDPKLFGSFFSPPTSWLSWMAFLDALQGQTLTDDQFERFRKFTGRKLQPTTPFQEAFVISGRRSGKSRISALVAAYLCLVSDLPKALSQGEIGWVVVTATKKEQAQVVLEYVKGLASKFRKEVTKLTTDEIHFANHTAVKVTAGTWRGIRGVTLLGAVVDELAFIKSDEDKFSAYPSEELLRALRPAIVRGGLLVSISTPYAPRGPLHAAWKRCWGDDTNTRTLVWRSGTTDMNPLFDREKIEQELAEDRASAMSEYFSEWREDLSSLIESSYLEAAMTRQPMPPQPGIRYVAFCDLSGGKNDSHAICVVHREGDKIIEDEHLEIQAGEASVDAVVQRFSELARRYGCREITGDQFGAEWASGPFAKAGTPLVKSPMAKSNLFLNAAALIKSGKCELIHSDRVLTQFTSLDRRPGPGGVDTVMKIPGSRDDLANAVAGALVTAHMVEDRMPALPVVGPHGADRLMTPDLKAERRRAEIKADNMRLMDEFMLDSGCTPADSRLFALRRETLKKRAEK